MRRVRSILRVSLPIILLVVALSAWLIAYKLTVAHGRTAISLGAGHGEIALLITSAALPQDYPRSVTFELAPPDRTLSFDPDHLIDWRFLGLAYVHYAVDYALYLSPEYRDASVTKWNERRFSVSALWPLLAAGGILAWWVYRSWRAGKMRRQSRAVAYYACQTLAIFSLLACVACVAAWFRGYHVVDRIMLEVVTESSPSDSKEPSFPGVFECGRIYFVQIHPGAIFVLYQKFDGEGRTHISYSPGAPNPQKISNAFHDPSMLATAIFSIPGLLIQPTGSRLGGFRLLITDWLAIALTVPYPAFWFLYWQKRCIRNRRAVSGLCVGCGYDLRASPDRCPECGMANTAKLSPLQSS